MKDTLYELGGEAYLNDQNEIIYKFDLIDRVNKGAVNELIMAISPTIEGETTIFYIAKQLKDHDVQISTIARGVSFGGELEYADEFTLGRSIVSRVDYDK